MIRVADYCVMLTDARGVTIDYRIDRDRRSDFKHAGLYIGSCWSEREEGSGIANVLIDLAPITVHKTDRFRTAFTTLTCSAAPIFAPTGEMIGVLDASALQSPDNRDSQPLVFQLVRQNAGLIEDGYFLNQTTQHWILFAHASRNFVEAQPEVLIAFDECGNLVAVNRKAHECIPGLSDPRHVDDVLDTSDLHLHDLARSDAIIGFATACHGRDALRVRAPLKRTTRSGTSAGVPRETQADNNLGAISRFLHSADTRIAQNAQVALRLAGKRLPILILGETGVGKEVFARGA
jgi:transcriptional regulator of acetoin/glycerol metabolism